MQCTNCTDNINVNERIYGSVKLRNRQLESQKSFIPFMREYVYFISVVMFSLIGFLNCTYWFFFPVSPPFVYLCAHFLPLNFCFSHSLVPQMNKCCKNLFFFPTQTFFLIIYLIKCLITEAKWISKVVFLKLFNLQKHQRQNSSS